ncbi:MAG TPA: molecular chaperone HtpG [Synergistaceae bacterium]|nr:molecular chaperone HtpG [Synergistaceae bacterium]HPQ36414.1 molecular chaperone HtpG [Synergistaceae bacterium]
MAGKETFAFKSEGKQLLDLMIHSIYSNKDIFLRELVSNSSDALDKLRLEGLTHENLRGFTEDLHIRLEVDKDRRILWVWDNGIGMTRQEIIDFIGTIAKSGTKEFLSMLESREDKELSPELIGQFGVGFYSSFMVANRVELVSRKAGEEVAWRWESSGDGTYSLEETTREAPGTTVILHLKEPEEEEGMKDYADPFVLRSIVTKYSDYVSWPIRMKGEAEEDKEPEDEVLNSRKALWTRPESDVEEEEYREFYHHISHDWGDPWERILYSVEGTTSFRGLLFIPQKAPMDLFIRDVERGISLYIRRVFIMQDCKELIPEYLRFLRGVVDAEDLSLNISREILQQDRHIRIIRRSITRKVLDTLKNILSSERERYETFWKEFGQVLKEGLVHDEKNREALLGLCLFESSSGEGLVSLEEYVERTKEGQEEIYFLGGERMETLRSSPHLEAFRKKGYEVLLLSDPVDQVWTQAFPEFQGKKFVSAGKGDVELGTPEEREEEKKERESQKENYAPLFAKIQSSLEDRVKDVRLSSRLVDSPACLVGDTHDMTPQLERMLAAMGQKVPKVKRILELNPEHPTVKGLLRHLEDSEFPEYAEVLYGEALLAEGEQLEDPGTFSRSVSRLLSRLLEEKQS